MMVYALLAGVVFVLGWLMEQALTTEIGNLLTALPTIQYQLYQSIVQVPWRPVREGLLQFLGQVNEPSLPVPAEVPFRLLETGRAVVEVIIRGFSVLIIAFFWIAERLTIRGVLIRLLPLEHRDRAIQIWDDVEDKLGAWVRAELILMAGIGVAFAVGLTLLGVKYAVLLAVFAGLMQAVPLVGPVAGTLPAVLVALTQSPEQALGAAAIGAIAHLIEGNVLLPRIMRHTTGVSPLTVVLGILIGGKLMGPPGALLAVPVAAGLQVLLTDLGVLADRHPATPEPVPAVHNEEAPAWAPAMEPREVA
jgi:predicted PurR-regulated permease PerM